MQKLYELVVILHPQLSKDEQDAIHAKVDGLLGKGKKQTDEMGLVQLAHPIGKARLTQAHIDSHYCELDAATVTAIKNELSITKGVVRHVFFAMAANEKFHSFRNIHEDLRDLKASTERHHEHIKTNHKDIINAENRI